MQSRSCILRAIERMGTGLAQGYEGLHIGVGSFPRVVIRENRRSNSMRRVVLLAVLALALPTAALANIIDYETKRTLALATATVTGPTPAGHTLTMNSELTGIGNTLGSLGTLTVTSG